jgi:hypothetical protein
MDISAAVSALQDAKFEEQVPTSTVADSGASILSVLHRDGVTITIEQKTTTDPSGLEITYPPVCVIQGSRGRAACSTADPALIVQVAKEVA